MALRSEYLYHNIAELVLTMLHMNLVDMTYIFSCCPSLSRILTTTHRIGLLKELLKKVILLPPFFVDLKLSPNHPHISMNIPLPTRIDSNRYAVSPTVHSSAVKLPMIHVEP